VGLVAQEKAFEVQSMTPQVVGWLGSVFLAAAGFPQLIKTFREGHARGMAWWYLILLWLGFFSMFVFTIRSRAAMQLILSYSLQLTVFSVILYFKIWPRKVVGSVR
jgi:uncharacterized protein with PQ loop repeat